MDSRVEIHDIDKLLDFGNSLCQFRARCNEAVNSIEVWLIHLQQSLYIQRVSSNDTINEREAALRRIRALEQAIENYHKKVYEFNSALENDIPKAIIFLQKHYEILLSYANLQTQSRLSHKLNIESSHKSLFFKAITTLLHFLVPPLLNLQLGGIMISLGLSGLSIGMPLVQLCGKELGVALSFRPGKEGVESNLRPKVSPAELVSPPVVIF